MAFPGLLWLLHYPEGSSIISLSHNQSLAQKPGKGEGGGSWYADMAEMLCCLAILKKPPCTHFY